MSDHQVSIRVLKALADGGCGGLYSARTSFSSLTIFMTFSTTFSRRRRVCWASISAFFFLASGGR